MRLLALLPSLSLLAASPLPFGFAPPEVFLSDFNTRSLRVGDINGDGLPDLLLLNNDRGRVDIHLQTPAGHPPASPVLRTDRWQPVLADTRFQRETLVLGGVLHDLVLGDFNSDSRLDFAVTDDQNRLVIYHGPLRPGWQPAATLPVTAAQNAGDTLAWDAQEGAIVLLGERDIQEVRWKEDRSAYEATLLASPPKDSRPHHLLLHDLDEDGRNDILYSVRLPRFSFAYHLRGPQGVDGVHLPLVDPSSETFTLLSASPLRFLGLHPRSGTLQQIQLVSGPTGIGPSTETIDTRFVDFAGVRNPTVFWEDLDGDGVQDILLHAPGQPEVSWRRGLPGHRFAPPVRQPVPPSAWIIHGHWLPGEAATQFLLHDPESGYLGLLQHDGSRLLFPTSIPNNLRLVGASAWRPSGAENDLLVAIVRSDLQYELRIWNLRPDGLVLLQETPLPDLSRDSSPPLPLPGGMLLVLNAHDNAFLLVPTAEALLHVVPTSPGLSTSLLRRKKPENLRFFPAGSGLPSPWALQEKAMLQFLQADPQGNIRIVDQINLHGKGTLAALLPLSPDASRIGLLDSSRNLLEWHERDGTGILAYRRDLPLPPFDLREVLLEESSDGPLLRIAGRDQAVLLLSRPPPHHLDINTLYESDLPETTHRMVLTGDFNGDKTTDILLLDPGRANTLEFLRQTEGGWSSAMHFQVYDTAQTPDGRHGGDTEPREALVYDINQDQLDDLLLLIHDRILLYLQDPLP